MMEMKLDKIYFDYIKKGLKLYETRIYDLKRRKIHLLDKVKFVCEDKSFEAVIIELSFFKNFKEAIEEVGIKKVLPNVKNLKEGIEIYNNFPHGEGGSFKTAAAKYGVLRMKFQLL